MPPPNIRGTKPTSVYLWNESVNGWLAWTGSVDATASVTVGAISATITNSAGWSVTVANPGDIGGGYQYPTGSGYVLGNSGSFVLAVNSATGLFQPFYLDADNNLKTTASVAMAPVSATILNTANWVVAQSNTSDLVRVTNSAGWIMSMANTSLSYAISNTSLSYNVSATIVNSGGWAISPISATILNSAGWVTNIANSAGWVFAQSNTSGGFMNVSATVVNSGSWVMSIANTGWIVANTALVQLVNTSALVLKPISTTILNSAGWVVSVANTIGSYSIANTGWVEGNTARCLITNPGDIGGGFQYADGGSHLAGNTGNLFFAIDTNSIYRPLNIDDDGNLKTVANIQLTNVAISNSAGWVVSVANTSLFYNVSATILNTGGYVMSVANTLGSYSIANTGWIVANTALVQVINTAGVMVGNTAGVVAKQGGAWNISSTILNSGGWVVSIANTAGGFWNTSATILNSAGWIVSVANTGWIVANTALVQIINTAGVMIGNTAGVVAKQGGGWAVSSTILNTGGYVMSVANTLAAYSIANTSLFYNVSATVLNTGGYVMSVANTLGSYAISNTGWVEGNTARVFVTNAAQISGGQQYASGSAWVVGNTGNAVWAVNSVTGLYAPFYLDADNNLKTSASVNIGALSATILNSANWIVSQANTSLYYNVSATVLNTGGYVMSVANTLGSYAIANTAWIIANTAITQVVNTSSFSVRQLGAWSISSTITNSGGWIMSVANTSLSYSIANTSLYYNVSATVLNTGGYVMSVANTLGSYAIANTSISYNVSATIVNSGSWVTSIANTGWIVANTALVQLINTSALTIKPISATILNSGGWAVNVNNTAGWVLSIANTGWVENNTARVQITNPGDIGGGFQVAQDAVFTKGDTGTLALVVRMDTPRTLASAESDNTALIVDSMGMLYVNASGAVQTRQLGYWNISSTITNSGGWIVSMANTGWIQANTALVQIINTAGFMVGNSLALAGTTQVFVTNTAGVMVGNSLAIAGTPYVWITNTAGVVAKQGGYWVVSASILNSGGWIVNVANSGGWIFAQSNTSGGFMNVSATVTNSGGWIVSVANTGWIQANTALVQVINTAGVVAKQGGYWAVSSTILNSGGWVVSLANTGWVIANTALVQLINTSAITLKPVSATILNSGGWIVNASQYGTWNINIVSQPTALSLNQWFTTMMTTATGNILTSAANGSCHRIYHINCNNAGPTDVGFWLVNSNGNQLRRYYLAKSGGIVSEQLNPPVTLSLSGNLYYNYVEGANAKMNIALHYETVKT